MPQLKITNMETKESKLIEALKKIAEVNELFEEGICSLYKNSGNAYIGTQEEYYNGMKECVNAIAYLIGEKAVMENL